MRWLTRMLRIMCLSLMRIFRLSIRSIRFKIVKSMKCRNSWILMDGNLCFNDKTGENISFENGFYYKVRILGNRKFMFQGQNLRNYFV